jgi:hypothetical protein
VGQGYVNTILMSLVLHIEQRNIRQVKNICGHGNVKVDRNPGKGKNTLTVRQMLL